MARAGAKREVLRAIARHDGEWYWYQVDRAVSGCGSDCVGPFFDEIQELAATPDILSLGMLADALRRRLHDTRVTFLRVAAVPFDAVHTILPAAAREVRLTGTPASLDAGVASVEAARAIPGR